MKIKKNIFFIILLKNRLFIKAIYLPYYIFIIIKNVYILFS